MGKSPAIIERIANPCTDGETDSRPYLLSVPCSRPDILNTCSEVGNNGIRYSPIVQVEAGLVMTGIHYRSYRKRAKYSCS